MSKRTSNISKLIWLAVLATAACETRPPDIVEPEVIPDIDREEGDTSFLSADARAGQQAARDDSNGDDAASPDEGIDADAGGDGAEERTVEEGDIYRVLGNNRILNLNAYRGLQILDISDPQNPVIEGAIRTSGTPVELYVHNDHAFVLLNNWSGYWGNRDDIAVEAVNGGLVLSVDISNPQSPVVLDREVVPGYIRKSRLVKNSTSAALYVAAQGYNYSYWNDQDESSAETPYTTYIRSFDAATGLLDATGEIDLGSHVTDIQATNTTLMVATFDWYTAQGEEDGGSEVQLIDISDPQGAMVQGQAVQVEGRVESQFNMDIHNGILRVVSGNFWNAEENTNFLETFDATNISSVVPVDTDTFGENEDLYATLFLGNKAFFVTYERVDPFHAFSIDDNGIAEERSEFIVSGWNDFFKPVYGDSRILGVGIDDAEGERSLAISLYDASDLDNQSPLIARVDAATTGWGWSEANWDHRAFSVLENVTSVTNTDGVIETGLVLLPFSGWDEDYQEYRSGVQIYSFSEDTLTARGVMEHPTQVRRSFLAGESTANLGDLSVKLYDTENVDAPVAQGELELAPNYQDLLRLGAFNIRLKDESHHYYWWGDTGSLPNAEVQIISDAEHADGADAIASVEVKPGSQLRLVGDLLTATSTTADYGEYPYVWTTTIKVIDLSDPTVPVVTGELVTEDISPDYGYYNYGYADDCWDCGYGYGFTSYDRGDVFATDEALIFLQREYHEEIVGSVEQCNWWVESDYCDEGYETENDFEDGEDDSGEPAQEDCIYYSGYKQCQTPEGEDDSVCQGSFQKCTVSEEGHTCEEVDESEVEGLSQADCYDYDQRRYWTSFSLVAVDLSDPTAPVLTAALDIDESNEGVSALQDGDSVWVSYARPHDVEGDPLPYVRYYIQEASFADLAGPALQPEINVPGVLLEKDDDIIFTRDVLWGEEVAETAVARLKLDQGLAFLKSTRVFEDQVVESLHLDGAGHILATHRVAWNLWDWNAEEQNNLQLTIMDGADLAVKSQTEVDSWGRLVEAQAGRAFFEVGGGILYMNTMDASAPTAQGFFPYQSWGWSLRTIFDGDRIVIPAGRFGVYEYALDEFTLVTE